MDDNAPSPFRQQHGKRLLMFDLALEERVIDESQHKDFVFFLQMRDAFHAKSEGRNTVIGKMADGETSGMSGDGGHSLADKYMTYLMEFDKMGQKIMGIMIMPERDDSRLKHVRGIHELRAQIQSVIHDFGEWCYK